MGSWGFSSHSSDSCRDQFSGSVYDIDQAVANETVEKCFNKTFSYSYDNKEIPLGVVILILEQDLFVESKYLEIAAKFAVELYNDNEYLDCFTEPEKRKAILDSEINKIQKALRERISS